MRTEESNLGDGSNRFEESPVFPPLAATVECWALAARFVDSGWTFIPATGAPPA